jgi:putative zinc finger/helix-turn-helix YgiT family protein
MPSPPQLDVVHKRVFSKKCASAKCGRRTVTLALVPYTVRVDHDGRKYDVSLAALSVPKCDNCGAISIDAVAEKQIDHGFRQTAGLLTPEEIRKHRDDLHLTQKELAVHLGVAPETLSRWENGPQVQQRAYDRFLRTFFAFPDVRAALADEARLMGGGMATIAPPQLASTG